jgi:multidrug resistance efflux pump
VTARLCLLGVLACGGAGHRDGDDSAVRTAVVQPGEVVDRVLLTGALHPLSAVDLVVPSVDGATLAIRWMVADGAVVRAGDPVVAFDSTPFTGKLQENHATLRQEELRFRLDGDSAALSVQDKQLEVRRKQNDRDKARLQADLPPDLTTARIAQENQLALTRSEAALTRASQELAALIAKHALEQRARQIDLDKTRRSIALAEHAIEALVVKAPRDGVVVIAADPSDGHKLHPGELVREGAAIASLPDLTRPMEVRADVIDVDDGRVGLAMAGTCTLDGYPADPLPCHVETLAPVARAKDPGSLRRSFAVTLALAPSDPGRLRPGMAVKIELHRQPLHGLVIPRGAVLPARGTGDPRARVRLGTGEVREVTLAACDAQHCAVASGLTEGDTLSREPDGGPS